MKHTILYIAAIAAAAMTFGACSDDSGITPEPTYEGNKVIVSASVGSIFTRTYPLGDKTKQTQFKAGDIIAVSDGSKDVEYMYEDLNGTWNAAIAGQYLTWTGGQKTFQAYYPATNNSYAQGTLSPDQSTADGIAASDYMKATKTTTETDNHVLSLEFERQTARVIVKIKGYNDQYTSTTTIESVKVYSQTAIPASGGYSAIYTYKNGDEYVALVVPAAANSSQLFLSIDIHPNGDTSATETLTVTGIPAMEASKSYTYNVTVGKNAATINSVSVSNWGAGTAIPGGKATLPLASKVTSSDLGKVVTSNGNIYATSTEATAAGETAVGMIAYVGSETGNSTYNHGLVIALEDANSDYQNTSVTTASTIASNYTTAAPTGSSGWLLPSVNQLKRIFAACGGTEYSETLTNTLNWSIGNFNAILSTCGGTGINSGVNVATSDAVEGTTDSYWVYNTNNKFWFKWNGKYTLVRAVFAF